MRSDGLGHVVDSSGPKTSKNEMQPIVQVSTHHHSAIQPHQATPASPRGHLVGRTTQLNFETQASNCTPLATFTMKEFSLLDLLNQN